MSVMSFLFNKELGDENPRRWTKRPFQRKIHWKIQNSANQQWCTEYGSVNQNDKIKHSF